MVNQVELHSASRINSPVKNDLTPIFGGVYPEFRLIFGIRWVMLDRHGGLEAANSAGAADPSCGPNRVHAHDSFAATYFVDQEITVKRILSRFLCCNPHSFVRVEAPDKDNMQTRSAVWGGGAELT